MKLIGEALRNLGKRPFTEKYPDEKPKVPLDLRGKVIHIKDRCIYCGICAKYCPSGAITVDRKNKEWKIDYGKCLFCQQCEEACRDIVKKNAIKLSSMYEMINRDKSEMVHKDKADTTPPGQPLPR
ncbi:MAG: 4Fe-4S ferredoxin [Candidatus Aenigmatarchaeota archaeon]|nr:MAG: 4Fe-4S ferredoxin [Candidatus Aenigmarchaeota archaeon]